MKAALVAMMMLGAVGGQDAAPTAMAASVAPTVEVPWTAHLSRSDPGKLQLSVREKPNSSFGMGVKLADFEGLSEADLRSGKPVSFRLRREAGIVTFSGVFEGGDGAGKLRYDADPAYWSRLTAMGVRNDMAERGVEVLGLPLLDVRTDYIDSLRREGADGPLSDFVGMRALNVRPELARALKPLIAGALRSHDLMALTALNVTPDYAREMGTAFPALTAQNLTGLKALGVTGDYVRSLRAAGARVATPGDAQSFRALGISPAAVQRAVANGQRDPSASDVMRMSMRF